MALTKTEIISTALGILDAYGLNDLTMRRLADSLDVKASALYWHVANKQSLLAELVDKILAGLEPPSSMPRRTVTRGAHHFVAGPPSCVPACSTIVIRLTWWPPCGPSAWPGQNCPGPPPRC